MKQARRIRKMFGGTMRQTGMLAGAALFALQHHVTRLHEDHQHAQTLAKGLNEIRGIACDASKTDTNLVFFTLDRSYGTGEEFCRKLWDKGVLAESLDPQRIRFVTHLGVSKTDIEMALQITADICNDFV
jgi:threonine aldolase